MPKVRLVHHVRYLIEVKVINCNPRMVAKGCEFRSLTLGIAPVETQVVHQTLYIRGTRQLDKLAPFFGPGGPSHECRDCVPNAPEIAWQAAQSRRNGLRCPLEAGHSGRFGFRRLRMAWELPRSFLV